MTSPSAGSPERAKPKGGSLARRLPFVGFVLIGLFIWRGGLGLVAAERTVTVKAPGNHSTVRRLELQLYDGDTLIKREEWRVPQGLTLDPVERLPLKQGGEYSAVVMIWRGTDEQPEVYKHPVVVGAEKDVVIGP